MSNSILDYLVEQNEFPIIFIGSGISKRYLEEYPGWVELLEYLWSVSKSEGNFYGYLTKIRDEIKQAGEMENYIIEYKVNTRVATELEKAINTLFADGELTIEGIDQKRVYEENLSPFKALICNRFESYGIRVGMDEEYEFFTKMLNKAQIILTTNYDSFIEDSYNNKSEIPIKKYIGQRGFFEQTTGYAELYKIHGCSSSSNTIVITQKDYEKFNKDSVLISAKIISMLLNSPIIFIGYSLKDANIRNIIKDFTNSLTAQELLRLEKKLIVIEWEDGQEKIIESVVTDNELGCRLTTIKTNNYYEIYKKIEQINQGVAPAEIRRNQHVIKRLIVERGKEGTLETVLLSPNQLYDIEEVLKKKNIVVAIGDSTLVFVMPTLVTYTYDYIAEKTQQNTETILRFIANQQGRIPFIKYVTSKSIEESNLNEREKKNLRNRLKKFSDLKEQISTATQYYIGYTKIDDIKLKNFKEYMEYNTIARAIDKIPLDDVKKYIIEKLDVIKTNNGTISSELRRLTLIYDLIKNK